MRDLLDHLARHGRWVSWGPARHGIAGNIATYVRITEEPCHVELYCDMERLAGRPRPARLPGRPLLVEHLGAAAAALVLPLRPGRGRVRARELGDARTSAPAARGGRVTLRGYTVPRTPEGRSSLVPYPPWHYVGTFLVVDYWADAREGGRVPPRRASTRTRTPAAARSSRPTGSRARRTATSSSTRRARSTRRSSSSSTGCSTARR